MSEISATQKWLALEHEAVLLFPLVGARFLQLTTAARRSYEAHLTVRDDLINRLHQAGAEPVATALTYDVGTLTTVAEAQKSVRSIESRIAAACLALVGETTGKDREFATSSLRAAALAELTWGGAPTAFPGLP